MGLCFCNLPCAFLRALTHDCGAQKGNPVLKHIRNVRWLFGDIVPDYLLGQSACALYLR